MEFGIEEKTLNASPATEWTAVQRDEGAFFDRHWIEALAAGKLNLVIPPDELLFQEDLGRSLSYMLDRMGDLSDKRVIDLGCGPGDFSIFVARHGAQVEAVDVAPSALEITRQRAEVNGVAGRVHTHLMPVERLDFPDASFDWVLGFGVLHHVDLHVLGTEMQRILKPGGRALFREPLGTNPFLEFTRKFLPYQDKYHSRHERPLTYDDIATLSCFFAETHVREFYLCSSVSRLLGGESSVVFRVCFALDELLLQYLPFLHPLCRYVVVEYA